ncbi:MAG: hypothetical protein IJ212_00910 [Bacteroidaceae bacterium]|nr:hypothetical protein [Bacteroidaceae bacterium]
MDLFSFNLTELIAAGVAFLAVIISWHQYKLYKARERSKVFTSLNVRYLESEDVQAVVKYLSKTGRPATEIPDDYRTELFLRFFEEVGVYLESESLEPKPVEQLFGYYLYEIFTSEKGKELLKACDYHDSQWEYLVKFKNYMSKVEAKWKDIPSM